MELPEAVAAEIKAINEAIKARDRQADEKWEEFKRNPDALIGESVKKLLDANAADREKKQELALKALEKEFTDRLDEMETKAQKVRNGFDYSDPDSALKAALDKFEQGGGYKPRHKTDTADFTIPVKAVSNITNANLPDNGSVRPGIWQAPQAPLMLRNLVASGTIDGFYFKYERELAGSMEGDAGYQTAEGEVKPNMDIYTEIVSQEVATIAVTSRISQQAMNDRAAFASFLRARMGYRVLRKLDREILNGAGGAGEIEGINTVATAYDVNLNTATGVTSTQKLDVLRIARLQVELSDFVPDGVVLHPTDWAGIELMKDADERYLISSPTNGAPGRVWGLPVVSTTGQAVGDFTVGDFMGGAQLFMREEMNILASTEDQDNFVRNLVTIRAELRALLAIYSTLAFVTGDFATAIAGPVGG